MNPDHDILQALAGGQPEAVAALYRRHGARMLAFARRYVKTDGAADDVVSGLIGRWLERPPRVRDSDRLAAFLATSVYHAAIDWMRRERAERGQPPRDPGRPPPHEVASRRSPVDLRAQLSAALEKLTPSERTLLETHYGQALSTEECMEMLGITRAAFHQRLHRARVRLAELMG